MSTYIKYQLKLILKSKLWFLSLLVSASAMALSLKTNWINIEIHPDTQFFFIGAGIVGIGTFAMLAPIIIALPIFRLYIQDRKNNMLSATLIRTNRKDYFIANSIISSIIGGLAICLPLLILLIITIFIYGTGATELGYTDSPFRYFIHHYQFLFIIIIILNSFLFGVVYANISLMFAFVFKNTYLSLIGPFFVYIFPNLFLPFMNAERFSPAYTYMLTFGGSIYRILGQLFLLLIISISIGYYQFVIKEEDLC